MKLVVGLGNKGKEYKNTRHNVGFWCIENFCCKNNITNYKNKMNGKYYETKLNNEKIILLKPQKYMNLSGEVVNNFLQYFKIKKEDLLIIVDDLDLEVGKLKLKYKGSSGGHNGL